METIKQILMRRDSMSEKDADELIADAIANMQVNDADPSDVCEEWFGLEPDYVFELLELADKEST